MKKYLTSILLCVLTSLVLAGCTSQPSQEEPEAHAALESFAKAIAEADEQKISQLFCPEMDTAQFMELVNMANKNSRESFRMAVISAQFNREKSGEGRIFYTSPFPNDSSSATELAQWIVKKTGNGWCIEIYDAASANLNNNGSELQQRMREAREQEVK